MGHWIFGVLMGLLAFVGLFLASRAEHPMFSVFGFAMTAFGIIIIFAMIHRATGSPKGETQHVPGSERPIHPQ